MKQLSTGEWIAVAVAVVVVLGFMGAQFLFSTSPLQAPEEPEPVLEEVREETATSSDDTATPTSPVLPQ